ncbi:hypothetical protein T484DRAFT_2113744 [Baffinella frigidus]|nr:hypothetical protein T484DRAFT_2113744 [Cryptophyta sp. CCMP2293]
MQKLQASACIIMSFRATCSSQPSFGHATRSSGQDVLCAASCATVPLQLQPFLCVRMRRLPITDSRGRIRCSFFLLVFSLQTGQTDWAGVASSRIRT